MSFLLLWSFRTSGVILLGLILASALHRRSAATRSLALRLTLAAAVLVPLAGLVAPRVMVPAPRIALPAAIPINPLPRTTTVPTPITQGWSVEAGRPGGPGTDWTYGFVRTTPFSSYFFTLPGLLLALWAGGFGLLVLRWVAGFERLRHLRRNAAPANEPGVWWSDLAVPATFGRTILLPRDARTWPEARLRAAILHERAHIVRYDWHWQALASLFAAIHWANPFAWLLARALRDAAEAAADDAVLAQGIAPSAYARELLAVAATAISSGPALAMARRGGVRERVVAVLADRDRRRPTRLTAGLLLAAVLGMGFLTAGVTQADSIPKDFTKSLSAGGRVEIVSLANSQIAWSPTGKALVPSRPAPDPDFDRRYVRPDEHSVEITLRAAELPKGSEPWVRLTGPGVGFSTALHDGQAHIRWSVKKATETEVLRVGVAAGSWTPYVGPPIAYRLGPWAGNGQDSPMVTTVAFPFPRAFAEDNVRVRLLDAAGSTLGSTITEPRVPVGQGPYLVSDIVRVGVARNRVVSVAFDTREYETVEFPPVAVAPRAAVPMPVEVGVIQAGSHTVELIALADPNGKRVWLPDGRPGPSLSVIDFRAPVRPGWRRVVALVRTFQAGGLQEPNARITAWSKYAYPSDRSVYAKRNLPGEYWAWCSLELRKNVRAANLGVDLQTGPWRTDADVVAGSDGLRVFREGAPRSSAGNLSRQIDFLLPGKALPGRDRFPEMKVYGAEGNLLVTYTGAYAAIGNEPNYPDGSYTIFIPPGQRIGRVILRSRAIQHARFDAVRLYPNP